MRTSGLVTTRGFIGVIQRHQRTAFDAGWRVANNIFKFFSQFGQHLTDTFTGQCFFIAGLQTQQHKQVVAVLILDQGLIKRPLD